MFVAYCFSCVMPACARIHIEIHGHATQTEDLLDNCSAALFVNYNTGNKDTTDGSFRVNLCKVFSEERQTCFGTYIIRFGKTRIVHTSDFAHSKFHRNHQDWNTALKILGITQEW